MLAGPNNRPVHHASASARRLVAYGACHAHQSASLNLGPFGSQLGRPCMVLSQCAHTHMSQVCNWYHSSAAGSNGAGRGAGSAPAQPTASTCLLSPHVHQHRQPHLHGQDHGLAHQAVRVPLGSACRHGAGGGRPCRAPCGTLGQQVWQRGGERGQPERPRWHERAGPSGESGGQVDCAPSTCPPTPPSACVHMMQSTSFSTTCRCGLVQRTMGLTAQ